MVSKVFDINELITTTLKDRQGIITINNLIRILQRAEASGE